MEEGEVIMFGKIERLENGGKKRERKVVILLMMMIFFVKVVNTPKFIKTYEAHHTIKGELKS